MRQTDTRRHTEKQRVREIRNRFRVPEKKHIEEMRRELERGRL